MKVQAILFLAALLGTPAFPGDCPQPKPLTCEQLAAKAEQRHCLPKIATVAPAAAVPCVPVPCANSTAATANCSPVPCSPTVVEKVSIVEVAPKRHGNWFVGGGALYQQGWGTHAVMGYTWASGLQLIVGPNYVAHDPARGSTGCMAANRPDLSGHDSHGNPPPCMPMAWETQAGSPWGGTALLIYNFKK